MQKILKYSLLVFSILLGTGLNAFSEETDKESKPNSSYLMLYEEGTPNIISPHVWKKNLLFAKFGHAWFYQDFPFGSNPYGNISFTPFDNFQIDSILSTRDKFEIEIGTKYQIFNQYKGDFLSLSPRISYNTRGNVFGAELSADKVFFEDRLMLGISYSFLNASPIDKVSTFYQTVGLNSIFRFWGHLNIFGDIVVPIDINTINTNGFNWSVGLKDQMMGTPHNVTLYIGNSNVNTITGRTISGGNKYPNVLKMGFEFSIIFEDITKLPNLIFKNP